MCEMKRAQAFEREQSIGAKFVPTLVIASAIIVAVRLAREDIGRPSPKISAAITDAVSLARGLLQAVLREYPTA
jgi:hypothetical protein